jgi:hypothetical protein
MHGMPGFHSGIFLATFWKRIIQRRAMITYRIQTPDEVLAWAQQSNWLLIWAPEDYRACAFLSPGGNIVEFQFEKNKVMVRTLLSYECK